MSFVLTNVVGVERTSNRVEGSLLRIGRGSNADLRFDDAGVALEHVEIVEEESGFRIVDLGSLTGTYVNGKAVAEWRLADGDAIDIGPVRLGVRITGRWAPLELEIRPHEQEAAPAASAGAPGAGSAAPAGPAINYVAAYRLRRGGFNKAWLSLLLTLAAAVAVLVLPIAGWTTAFRPGRVSEKHASLGCAYCHAPWRGPTDALCGACHGAKGSAPAPAHHPELAAAGSCGACHFEHRDLPRLTAVTDRSCVDCHRDLRARSKGALTFARTATSFADDHPDFSLTLAGGRLPLGQAVASRRDPARLRFSHQVHLKERLRGLPKEVLSLGCESCHRGVEEGREPELSYDLACASCHPLTFDSRLPKEQAPHRPPEEVHRFLIVAFAENPQAARSLFERRTRILEGGARGDLDVSPRVLRAANDAEIYLFRTACAECHEIDLRSSPPRVAPTAIPHDWLPHARFTHAAHRENLKCADCHAGAAESRKATDVLLPGIATCRPCHGGDGPLPRDVARRATNNGCVNCHGYHPKNRSRIGTSPQGGSR